VAAIRPEYSCGFILLETLAGESKTRTCITHLHMFPVEARMPLSS